MIVAEKNWYTWSVTHPVQYLHKWTSVSCSFLYIEFSTVGLCVLESHYHSIVMLIVHKYVKLAPYNWSINMLILVSRGLLITRCVLLVMMSAIVFTKTFQSICFPVETATPFPFFSLTSDTTHDTADTILLCVCVWALHVRGCLCERLHVCVYVWVHVRNDFCSSNASKNMWANCEVSSILKLVSLLLCNQSESHCSLLSLWMIGICISSWLTHLYGITNYSDKIVNQ